jgi:hypothetical protein
MKYYLLLVAFALCLAVNLSGQEPLSPERWEELAKGYEYQLPEPPKEQTIRSLPEETDPSSSAWWGVLIAFLAIAFLLWLYWKLEGSSASARNRRNYGPLSVDVQQVERQLDRADLPSLLREALQSGNYPLALRLRYLMLIRALADTGLIQWKPDRTNGYYVRVLKDSPHAPEFREQTRIYETIWYGNQTLDAEAFGRLEPRFVQLETNIRKTRQPV